MRTNEAEQIDIESDKETPSWRKRVENHIREPCLIVGCGKGTFLDLSEDIYGVDFFKKATYNASKSGEGRVIQAEAGSLPFGEKTFECVLMIHSLEHFPSPLRAVKEAHRVLVENGELYIEVPNSSNYVSERRGHIYGWTKRTMSNLLHRAGFDEYSVEYLDLWGSVIPPHLIRNNTKIEHILDIIHNIIFPNNFRRLRAIAHK